MKTMMKLLPLTLALVPAAMLACNVDVRDATKYRDDTTALLNQQNAAITTCYNNILTSTPTATGNVVVNFTVEVKTGKIINPTIDPSSTSTDPTTLLNACVLTSLKGLVLNPPDTGNNGGAQFTWAFNVPAGTAAASPAAAPMPSTSSSTAAPAST